MAQIRHFNLLPPVLNKAPLVQPQVLVPEELAQTPEPHKAPHRALQHLVALTILHRGITCEPDFYPVLNAIPVPLAPVDPAATKTILPVLCVLQTEPVVVLPNIERDLTLRGPTEDTLLLQGILLIIHNGVPSESTELTLWT